MSPILHFGVDPARGSASAGAIELSLSAVDRGSAANRSGTGACPLRNILCKLAVPRAGCLGHCSLGRHPFFDVTPTVITLVGLHLPLHSVPLNFNREWISIG